MADEIVIRVDDGLILCRFPAATFFLRLEEADTALRQLQEATATLRRENAARQTEGPGIP